MKYKGGDILLIPFPFSGLADIKIRPVVVVCETRDKFKDLVVCAISSVIPESLTPNQILIDERNESLRSSGLRKNSVIKVDRIATLKSELVIKCLGKLTGRVLNDFIETFRNLVN